MQKEKVFFLVQINPLLIDNFFYLFKCKSESVLFSYFLKNNNPPAIPSRKNNLQTMTAYKMSLSRFMN